MEQITNDGNLIKKNMLYNSIGNAIYLGFQWIITILVARISGYEDAGILTLAMSISNVIYAISAFGMRNYQSSDIENRFDNNTYVVSRIITCLLGTLVIIVFLLFTSYSINTKLIIFTYIIFKISEALVDVFHGAEQKVWRMDIIGISFALRGILTFIAFIVTLFLSKNLLYAVIAMALIAYLVIIFFDISKYKNIFEINNNNKKIEYKSLKNLFIICIPLTIFTFLSNGIQTYPKYLLENVTGSEILGIYSSVATPVLIIQVAASFVFNPLITLFGELYVAKKKKEIFKLILMIVIFIIVLGIVAFIFSCIFGEYVLCLLYGDSIKEYSYLLQFSIVTMILTTLVTFINILLTVVRDFKTLLIGNILGMVLAIVISNIWIVQYGINGMNPTLIVTLFVELNFMMIFGLLNINKSID